MRDCSALLPGTKECTTSAKKVSLWKEGFSTIPTPTVSTAGVESGADATALIRSVFLPRRTSDAVGKYEDRWEQMRTHKFEQKNEQNMCVLCWFLILLSSLDRTEARPAVAASRPGTHLSRQNLRFGEKLWSSAMIKGKFKKMIFCLEKEMRSFAWHFFKVLKIDKIMLSTTVRPSVEFGVHGWVVLILKSRTGA